MKIGIVTYLAHDAHASLTHIRSTTATALHAHHALQPYAEEYAFASGVRRRRLLQEWLSRCDVVVGAIDENVLQARDEAGCRTPYVCFLMGHLSRGAIALSRACRYLRTSDVLIGNCAADLALADLFLQNATVQNVPFGYDASIYYPADQAAQRALRDRWSIDPADPLIVYAGRIALEKNLHTVLKAFRVVLDTVPAARLVIAGPEIRTPFHELGAFPLGITRMLRRLMTSLALDDRQVLLVGDQTPDDLRVWYSTANALVNLTLHHDENFGLVQIEAMACGLPVVGTAWGGLNDTIADGVSGYKVPAVVTPVGVKVDWWRAANRLVQLLEPNDQNRALRQSCRARAEACYSMARYQHGLEQAIETSVAAAGTDAAATPTPLQPTAFAQRYWTVCFGSTNGKVGSVDPTLPPYRRGDEAWDLYRQMISRFAGASGASGDEAMSPSGRTATCGWCLAAALSVGDGAITINDPIFPHRIAVPHAIADDVSALVGAFAERPVLADAEFDDHGTGTGVRDALTWMADSGLILRTAIDTIEPTQAHRALGAPVFAIHDVDHLADILSIA